MNLILFAVINFCVNFRLTTKVFRRLRWREACSCKRSDRSKCGEARARVA
ncbi:TraY domain-containing protein [Leptospira wolffii]|nr:TraY domain-containing protein [Leptospira wolffii]TGK71465.1 TraY domain-containing protein [Leptospira wolffii]TGL29258.1 TraY domain-containing protein [Leptospira wolffii]